MMVQHRLFITFSGDALDMALLNVRVKRETNLAGGGILPIASAAVVLIVLRSPLFHFQM